jgi:hypothetical protein
MGRKLIPVFDDGYTEEQREKIRAYEQDAANRKAKGETCGNCFFFKAEVKGGGGGRCLVSRDGIKTLKRRCLKIVAVIGACMVTAYKNAFVPNLRFKVHHRFKVEKPTLNRRKA